MTNNNATASDIHHQEHYDLLQICPVSGLQIIWLNASEEFEGRFVLGVEPCPLLGLAAVATRTFQGHRLIKEDDPVKVVVALSLAGGYFDIADECDNFVGLCREDEDPYVVAKSALLPDQRETLIWPPGAEDLPG